MMHPQTMQQLDIPTQRLIVDALYHTQKARLALADLRPKLELIAFHNPKLAEQVRWELQGVLDLDNG